MRRLQADAKASPAKYSAIANNMDNIRGLFGGGKNSVPRDLEKALSLLNLKGLSELEDRVLSLDAFLRPWSVFRDNIFLMQANAIRGPTTISTSADEKGISRTDILWFYTQYDEGVLRYDPRADVHNAAFVQDKRSHGVIDKRHWGVEEHEKHLYAWLLQEFKVGKSYNPWRFTYFELKSVCAVWEEVLVPIVDILRAAYDPKGRRFYGRLALYVEDRCPSSLAFPNSNIGVAEGSMMSPTPYRIVSVPTAEGSQSPLTRYADAVRRSFTRFSPMKAPDMNQKSPLHGVTRQLYFPDRASLAREDTFGEELCSTPSSRTEQEYSPFALGRCTSMGKTKAFLDTIPDDIEDGISALSAHCESAGLEPPGDLKTEPICPPEQVQQKKESSPVTRVPSYEGTDYHDEISLTDLHANRKVSARTPQPPIPVKPPTRLPAPVTPIGYGSHPRVASTESARGKPDKTFKAISESKLPVGLATDKDTNSQAGEPLPKPTPWPGFEFDDEAEAPPIPAKSPERNRAGRVRVPRPGQPMHQESEQSYRIVSKENIRAVLGDPSRDSFAEDMLPLKPIGRPVRTLSPTGTLQTYNTHLFPRRAGENGSSSSSSKEIAAKRAEVGGAYEMEMMQRKEDTAEDTDQKADHLP